MNNLLYKELKLSIHPMVWVFALFGLMIFIPTYPNSVFVIYVMMSFIFLFQGGRENNDTFYSLLLPIKKRDIVKARFISIFLFETLSIVLAAVAGICTYFMGYGAYGKQIASLTNGAGIGMAPTPAFFGLVFLSFSIFNAVFLNMHYKKGFKMLLPMLVASVLGFLPLLLGEVLASLFNTPLESLSRLLVVIDSSSLWFQLLSLFIGMDIYACSFVFTFLSCGKRFEKIDL